MEKKIVIFTCALVFCILLISIIYAINFTAPTPNNDTTTTNTSIEINVSITESDLDQVIWNWNGTNFTMYDDSLVLMMNFDNVSALGESYTTSDSVVVDLSNSGNNGTTKNSLGGSWNSTGKYSGAFEFDGNDDWMNISGVDLSNDPGTYNTLSFWMYWKGELGKTPIAWGSYYDLFTGFNGCFYMGFNTGNADVYGFNPLSPDLSNKWVHVTLIAYNGYYIDKNKIYIDGVEQTLSVYCNPAAPFNKTASKGVILGRLWTSNYFFNGLIDELRVWNRSLSADEIQQQYMSNLNKYDTDKWLLYVNQTKNSTAGLDDGTYTYFSTAKDNVGNENLTETRIITVDSTAPQINFTSPTNNSGVSVSRDYIEINVSVIEANLDTITIRLYNSINDLIKTNTSSTSPFYINYTGLSEGLYFYNATANDTSGQFSSTETRDITLDTTYPQINFTSPTPPNNTITTSTSIEINISITEIDLNEVKFNWNGTNYTMYNDSLVLMMNFDNVSALGENDTYVVDVSGYGNNGTCSGVLCPTWNTSGKFNGAYTFDESGDTITIPDHSSLDLTGNFTISVWVKLNQFKNYSAMVSKSPDTQMRNFNYGLWSYAAPTEIRGIIGDTINYNTVDLSGSLNTDEWYYIVFSIDGSYLSLYVNGILNNQTAQTITQAINNEPVLISRDVWTFNGTMDEIRIWNRSLSADEIQQQYFSNLRKYDTDKWALYVNQSLNATDGLPLGTYTYQAFAKDSGGNFNETDERTINIVPNSAPIMNTSRIYSVSQSTADELQGYCNATDVDGDKLSYFYEWYKNDILFSFGSLSNYTGEATQVGYFVNISYMSPASSVYVSGDYAYIASTTNESLTVIDVSTKSSPTQVGYLRNTSSMDGATFVYVSGDYAYVASRDNDSLTVIDVSTKSSPTQVGYLPNSSALDGAYSVFVSGDYAYVASRVNDSLTVVDISTKSSPIQIGYFANTSSMNTAYSVEVLGDYAYVAGYASDSLIVIDVSTPSSPTQIGYFTNTTSMEDAKSVHVSGDYAYVTGQQNDSLTVIDVSTPSSLTQIGYFSNASSMSSVNSVFVSGDYAYVTSYNVDSLTVIDVSTPSSLTQTGYVTNSTSMNGATFVYVSGDYAYVAGLHSASLAILDIADGFTQGLEINVNNIPSSQLSAGDWILGCKAYDNTNYSSWLNSSSLNIFSSTICTYSGSGDWNVNCLANCIVTTDANLPANTLNLYGTGTFTILANITADKVIKENTCKMINKINDGNRLIIKLG